jgi:isopenicillin-N epimerase
MFVDGAHSMSQVDIDIGNLECDAYFSTLHKWSFSPKNSGFIYISDKYSKVS